MFEKFLTGANVHAYLLSADSCFLQAPLLLQRNKRYNVGWCIANWTEYYLLDWAIIQN